MIRRYCDCCGVELSDDANAVKKRIVGETIVSGKTLKYQLTMGTGTTWNEGDLCDACSLVALLSDKRSRRVLATIAKTFRMVLDPEYHASELQHDAEVAEEIASPDVGFASHGAETPF